MSKHLDMLADEAERLPAAERIRLVERLLATLDRVAPEIDQAWAEEAEKRLDHYLAGSVEAREADEVLAKFIAP